MQSYELYPSYSSIDSDFNTYVEKNPCELYSYCCGFKSVVIAVDKKYYKVLYRGFDYSDVDSIVNRPVWKCAFKCDKKDLGYAVKKFNNMVEYCCGQPQSPACYIVNVEGGTNVLFQPHFIT